MRMQKRLSIGTALVAAACLWMTFKSNAQAPVIESFSTNGELVCKGLKPGSTATVEWAPSVNGPWTNSWAGLTDILVGPDGTIRVMVPMFYRVRGVPQDEPPVGMTLIPAGTFIMGDTFGEGYIDEFPVHLVSTKAFYIDKTEVTRALWDEVYRWATNHGYAFENPGTGKAPDHPVVEVNWYDCVKWCNARSEKEGRLPAYYTDAAHTQVYRQGRIDVQNEWVNWDGGYRLPTEAEWEKAARGGLEGKRFPWGDTISHDKANYYSRWVNGKPEDYYDESSVEGYHPSYAVGDLPYTSPVGAFSPNGYGLHDIAGNVWEWCWDVYSESYYSVSPLDDPRGPAKGPYRVSRGGCWAYYAKGCRVADRGFCEPSGKYNVRGFRCVLPVCSAGNSPAP